MTNHPHRSPVRITAIYRLALGTETYAAYFTAPGFKTNGANCDTPEIEALLMAALKATLYQQARAFHVAGGVPLDGMTEPRGKVLAFYTDRRAKALIDRFDRPIEF